MKNYNETVAETLNQMNESRNLKEHLGQSNKESMHRLYVYVSLNQMNESRNLQKTSWTIKPNKESTRCLYVNFITYRPYDVEQCNPVVPSP